MDKPTLSPHQRSRQPIYVGSNGHLRAGWAAVLFVVAFFAFQFLVSILAHPFLLLRRHTSTTTGLMPGASIATEALVLACIVGATAFLAVLERRHILSYGFQGAARATRFVWGLVWGFVAISALVLTLWKAHLLVFTGHTLGTGSAIKYAILWGIMFLIVGFTEESLFRGYLQHTLTRGLGFWWSAIILSLVFSLGHGHNHGESSVGLISAGLIGLVFCLSLWYTGSLWWAVGFHSTWDWGESYFYGVPDSGLAAHGHLFSEHSLGRVLWSGGSTGPEGSLLILPLIAIIALAMWLWWRRRAQSPFAGYALHPGWRAGRQAHELTKTSEPVA